MLTTSSSKTFKRTVAILFIATLFGVVWYFKCDTANVPNVAVNNDLEKATVDDDAPSILQSSNHTEVTSDDAVALEKHRLASKFIPIVEQGDIEAVKRLIAAGADVNASYKSGSTALMAARNPEIIKLLLDAGADPNARTATHRGLYGDMTVLMWHLVYGNPECVAILLAGGAEVNATSYYNGKTPLMKALERVGGSSPEVVAEKVKLLLAGGADVHMRSHGEGTISLNGTPNTGPGSSIMWYAALTWNVEVVKLLLDAGAEVDERPHGFMKEFAAHETSVRGAPTISTVEILKLFDATTQTTE